MVNLGDEVVDVVSGFKGIATGKSEFLYGCTRIGVIARAKGNETKDMQWFDEPQLKIVKRAKVKPATREQKRVGGPMPGIPTRNQYR
jgi:hypothetical protein